MPERLTIFHLILIVGEVNPKANFVLTKDRKRPYYGHFCGKIHRDRGLVVKRPGVLSKVQMLNLVLGVGVFSLHSNRKLDRFARIAWFSRIVSGISGFPNWTPFTANRALRGLKISNRRCWGDSPESLAALRKREVFLRWNLSVIRAANRFARIAPIALRIAMGHLKILRYQNR